MGAESVRGATKVPHGLETENYELLKCGHYPIRMRPFELSPKTNHDRFSPRWTISYQVEHFKVNDTLIFVSILMLFSRFVSM